MNRFNHALRHELLQQGRVILITSLAIAGSVMLINVIRWVAEPVAVNLWTGFGPVMVIAGVIITTGAFSEIRSPGTRIELLLRPARIVEKVGAKLLVSSLFYGLAITAAYLLVSLLALALYLLVGGRGNLLVFFDNGRWLVTAGRAFIDYLPLHGIFFFGALYFRRNPGGRTLLALVGSITGYVVLTLVMIRVVFQRYLSGRYSRVNAPRALGFELDSGGGVILGSRLWVHVIPGILQDGDTLALVFRILVPLVFWSLTLLRFRETEG